MTTPQQSDFLDGERPIREPLKPPVLTKAIRKAGHVADNGHGFGSLPAMLAHQTAEAAALVIAPATLAAWHTAQLAWTHEKAWKLNGVVENNSKLIEKMEDALEVVTPADWLERFWGPLARMNYTLETERLLVQRGHVLVCPNHGIDGVTAVAVCSGAEMFLDAAEDPIAMGKVYNALSNRGLLDGKPLGWCRYCLECQKPQLANLARRMARELVTDAPELQGV